MATAAQNRIDNHRSAPRIMALWWALRPLKSVIRFMQTGAHPDDEISGMLAALAFRDGINLSYACSTRGEGGQNDIGTEAGPALGALRTREMERACNVLRMRMYWHGNAPDDPITDFGFSKSGVETLEKWGAAHTLSRFVDIVRADRPDIICPTFLDVPGQHGHHRAMTASAHAVMTAAADPAFPSDHPPWQVKKLYLPAWSGAGQSYDDDEPPPEPTMVIDGSGFDPISGWTWEQIGQQSRTFHRTQGMGRWLGPGERRDWPLHLVESHVPGPDTALTAGLAATLGDLADLPMAAGIAPDLRAAQAAIDDALAAFPHFTKVANAAFAANDALGRARAQCPAAAAGELDHRLAAKMDQLSHIVRTALGVSADIRAENLFPRPGEDVALTCDIGQGDADHVTVDLDLPDGWGKANGKLTIGAHAAPADPYRAAYDPAVPDAPAAKLAISSGPNTVIARVAMEDQPMVLPPRTARISPDAAVINTTRNMRTICGQIDQTHPANAAISVTAPADWRADVDNTALTVTVPHQPKAGQYTLECRLDGELARTVAQIQHPHTAATMITRPATVRVLVVDAAVPDVRVGYIGAGNDRVNHWLAALGADVTDLSDAELSDEAHLGRFDTIVIGIFAMRFRAALAPVIPALHRWTKAGGTLVTLYHRPWDNWHPDRTPPRRLEIGQPSLRWRVTDENAVVRHLAPHPLLSSPNLIGPADWNNWVKERGLYFAKSWDPAYVPLIEIADPDEAPHQGALLAADIGKGRHVHTSLILHHQMENLVPGAFRLMANLIARRQ